MWGLQGLVIQDLRLENLRIGVEGFGPGACNMWGLGFKCLDEVLISKDNFLEPSTLHPKT